jgi:hypothetical protein
MFFDAVGFKQSRSADGANLEFPDLLGRDADPPADFIVRWSSR